MELTAHHDLRSVGADRVTLFNYYNEARIVRPRPGGGGDVAGPTDAMLAPLQAAGLEVHAVGDCVAPRDIEYATYEGHRAARLM